MVAASAHEDLDSISPATQEATKFSLNNRMTSKAKVSDIEPDSVDQYDSKALVNASMPVTAARFWFMLIVSSGSTMAAVGNMSGLFKPVDRLFVISHRVDPEVTSLLLPEVVGTAMKGRLLCTSLLSPLI